MAWEFLHKTALSAAHSRKLSAKNTKWKFMQMMCNVIHLGFVSAHSKEIVHLPISISPVFLWLTILLVLIVVVSWFYDTLFPFTFFPVSFQVVTWQWFSIFSLPLRTCCLAIFYRSNLRMSIGYLQPLVLLLILDFPHPRRPSCLIRATGRLLWKVLEKIYIFNEAG